MMPVIRFVIIALGLFYFALLCGGRPWAALCLIAIVVPAFTDLRGSATLAGIAPALVWLALSRITGNRELFFPYTMYLASYVALLLAGRSPWPGAVGGTLVVVVFTAVRIAQAATARILAVELVVAAVILGLVLTANQACPKRAGARIAIAAFASLLACAGLAL